jgi:excisionase family DNA binding protein
MDLTTNQAAAELGVSAQRVRQYIAQGRIRARKLGRDYLVDSESVAAFRPRPPGNPDLASAREIKKRRREADTAG